jgi:hypothetical protein
MAGIRPNGVRCAIALVLVVASVVAGGCGGSSKKTTTPTGTSATAAASTATTATSTSAPASTGKTPASAASPAGAVAVAAGRPITRAVFDHWLDVAAKGQTSAGQPPIVPGDPPAFKVCIAQVRKTQPSLAKQSTQQLKADCGQLFAALSAQVMDFLITSDWYQADAGRLKLLPSSAEVDSAYNSEKRQAFPTESGFRAFLSKTGQTAADVRFRVLVDGAGQRLLAREHGSQTARTAALTREVKQLYRAGTRCAPLVVMADCGNQKSSG